MKNISSITCIIDSGSILPEMQSHSEYLITPQRLTLTRRGKSADTQIIEGQWAYPLDKQLQQELFDLAAEKRCREYERVESADPPDGGETMNIIITYADDDTCTLFYDPGTTYRGADELVERIRQIIQSLDPVSAVIVQQP